MKKIRKCRQEGCNENVSGNYKYCLIHNTNDCKKNRDRISTRKWRMLNSQKIKESNKRYRDSTKGVLMYKLISGNGTAIYVGSANGLGRVTSHLTGNTHIHVEWKQWILGTKFLEYVYYATEADKKECKKNIIKYNDKDKYNYIDDKLKGWEIYQGYNLSCVMVADVSEFVTLDNEDERLFIERLFILQDNPLINGTNPMNHLEDKLEQGRKDFLSSIIDKVVWKNKNILGTFKSQGCIDLKQYNPLFNYKYE